MHVQCTSCRNLFETQSYEAVCPQCGARLRPEQPPLTGIPSGEAASEQTVEQNRSTPWEERATRGFWSGLYETAKESILHPVLFFRGMRVDHREGAALYYWIVYALAFACSILPRALIFKDPKLLGLVAKLGLTMPVALLLLLVVMLFSVYLQAGALHLSTKLWGAKGSFDVTFRVVAYSAGPLIFTAIPYLGNWVVAVLMAVLMINGLRWNHRMSLGKAIGSYATLMLLVFCFALVLALGIIVPIMNHSR